MFAFELRLVSILILLTVLVTIGLVLDYCHILRRPWRLGLHMGIIGILCAAYFTINALLPTTSLYGEVCYEGHTGNKLVALTFDDGPNPPHTLQLLDVLDKYNVQATFFLVGRHVDMYPDIAKEIAERGHHVGSHTYTHSDLLKLNEAQIAEEMDKATQAIERATGKKPQMLRPPHGFRDPVVLEKAKERNLQIVQWSVMARDWKKPGATVIADRVVNKVRNGSIILLHDGDGLVDASDRSQTVEATARIIQELQKQGYTFVSVDQLLQHHPPSNP